MPTVPRYEAGVQEKPLPAARVTTDAPSLEAFGGGASALAVGQETQRLGDLSYKLAEAEKAKADDIATIEFQTKLSSKKQELFWDPKTGAFGRKGKDALGAREDYGSQFDKYADDLEKGLSSNTQREMARKIRMKERLELDGQIEHHTFGEMQTFQKQTVQAGIATARNDGILNYSDPAKVQDSIRLQEALIYQDAAGKPPAMLQYEIETARSKTHSEVVTRMLDNGQDLTAKAHFEQNRAMFTGEDAAKMEKSLKEGSLRGESQRQSDAILAKHSDMQSALAEAKQVQDPHIRDAVTERVKDEFGLRKVAETQRVESLYKNAADIIDKTGNVDQIPPAQWSQFPLSDRAALKAYAKNRREGTQPETSWGDYYGLKIQASNPQGREEFKKMNLMPYRPIMADAEFKDLITLQTGLRNGDEKAGKALDGFMTDQQIVNDSLLAAGIDSTPTAGKKDATRVMNFRRQVDVQVRAVQERTGKKATNEEVQSIVDNLMVKGVTEEHWYGNKKKPAFELADGEKLDLTVKDIPKGDRAKIEEALKRRNIAVTEDKILDLYSRKLKGMVSGGN